MSSAEIDAISFLIREKQKMIAERNQEEMLKKKEETKRRNRLLAQWGGESFVRTDSARVLCSDTELQNAMADLLMMKGLK